MCKACDKRGKTWEGDDPVCGFSNNTFDPSNWNCASLNYLRLVAEELHVIDSMEDTHIATIPVKIDDYLGWIVLSWYKSRGKTSSARFIFDEIDIPLPLDVAEVALTQYRGYWDYENKEIL